MTNLLICQVAKELSGDYQIGDRVVVVYGNEWYPWIVQEVTFQYLYNLSVKYQNTLLWLLTVTEFLRIRPFHVFFKQYQSNFQVKDGIVVKCMEHSSGKKTTLASKGRYEHLQYGWCPFYQKTLIPTNSRGDFKMDDTDYKTANDEMNIDIKYYIYIYIYIYVK